MGELRGAKRDLWEGGHRVPFLACWPGKIKPGALSDETIAHVDLMATVAAILGAQLPANAGEDSHNILPALLGEHGGKRGQSPFVQSTLRAVPAGTDRRLVGDCPLLLLLPRRPTP
jgi:arylsulfatase A-like enzyme